MCQMLVVFDAAGEFECRIGTLAQLRDFLPSDSLIVRDPRWEKLSEPGQDNHCLCSVDLEATGAGVGYEAGAEYREADVEWRRT